MTAITEVLHILRRLGEILAPNVVPLMARLEARKLVAELAEQLAEVQSERIAFLSALRDTVERTPEKDLALAVLERIRAEALR